MIIQKFTYCFQCYHLNVFIHVAVIALSDSQRKSMINIVLDTIKVLGRKNVTKKNKKNTIFIYRTEITSSRTNGENIGDVYTITLSLVVEFMSFLYHLVVLFTERMRRNFESLDSDRQVLMKELDRLRKQYDDLIKQLEQTQVIVDQQKVNITIFLNEKY